MTFYGHLISAYSIGLFLKQSLRPTSLCFTVTSDHQLTCDVIHVWYTMMCLQLSNDP